MVHFAVVLFVIGGVAAVVAGNLLGRWPWVNRPGFRWAHVAAVGVVVAQAWLGQVCPLTTLESWLRVRAGTAPYSKSFIEHWLQAVLFYEAPAWVFVLVYTTFGLVVLLVWWRFPPRSCRHGKRNAA